MSEFTHCSSDEYHSYMRIFEADLVSDFSPNFVVILLWLFLKLNKTIDYRHVGKCFVENIYPTQTSDINNRIRLIALIIGSTTRLRPGESH